MGSSITPEILFFVRILTQYFTTKAKSAAERVLTFFYPKMTPCPLNGPVITLSHIIKFFMSSASESELGGIFITAQEMVAMRNTLEEMMWPHPKSPIKKDNSAAA